MLEIIPFKKSSTGVVNPCPEMVSAPVSLHVFLRESQKCEHLLVLPSRAASSSLLHLRDQPGSEDALLPAAFCHIVICVLIISQDSG